MKKVLKILISVTAAFLMIFVSSCSLLFEDNQTFKNNRLKNLIYEYSDETGRYCKFTISYYNDDKSSGDYIYEGNEIYQIMLMPNTKLKIKDSFYKHKEINDEYYYSFSNLPCCDYYYVIISADGSTLRFSNPIFEYICHKVN